MASYTLLTEPWNRQREVARITDVIKRYKLEAVGIVAVEEALGLEAYPALNTSILKDVLKKFPQDEEVQRIIGDRCAGLMVDSLPQDRVMEIVNLATSVPADQRVFQTEMYRALESVCDGAEVSVGVLRIVADEITRHYDEILQRYPNHQVLHRGMLEAFKNSLARMSVMHLVVAAQDSCHDFPSDHPIVTAAVETVSDYIHREMEGFNEAPGLLVRAQIGERIAGVVNLLNDSHVPVLAECVRGVEVPQHTNIAPFPFGEFKAG